MNQNYCTRLIVRREQERERTEETGAKLHCFTDLSIIHAVSIVRLQLLGRARQVVTDAEVTGDVIKVQSGDKLSKLSKSARESITELLLLSYIWGISGWTKKPHFHYQHLPKGKANYLYHFQFVISCFFLWGISEDVRGKSIRITLGRYISSNATQSSALQRAWHLQRLHPDLIQYSR